MSDTPRTDAMRVINDGHPRRMLAMTEHAQKLERELNKWKQMADWLADGESRGAALAEFEKLKGEAK